MSVESTLAQVSAIRQALANPAALIGSSAALSGGTEAPAADSTTGTTGAGEEPSFADALAQASGNYQGTAAPTSALNEPGTYSPTGLAGTTGLGYSSQLQSADGIVGSSLGAPGESAGARIVAVAESQLGQTEQPPGSNESPAIAPRPKARSQEHRGARTSPPGQPVRPASRWAPRGRESATSQTSGRGRRARAARSPTDQASCPSQAI